MARPDTEGAIDDAGRQEFHDYLHLRDNPAGVMSELWYHRDGDHSWLVVQRDTVTHTIIKVELAQKTAKKLRRRK